MKKIHGSLLLFSAIVCSLTIPFLLLAQEGEAKDSHVLPSGYVMKFVRAGGYGGVYHTFWIYPDGRVINHLGKTARIPPDTVTQWLKTIIPQEGLPFSNSLASHPSSNPLMGSSCFDCMFYQVTTYNNGTISCRLFGAGQAFSEISGQLWPLRWSPLMGEPEDPEEPPRSTVGRNPIKLGGNISAAKLIRKVEPLYPRQAIEDRISGRVVLAVNVDEEGNVSEVNVTEGHPLLAESAKAAVGEWKYSPTLLNGEPYPVSFAVTLIYSFTSSGEPAISVGGANF